MNIIQLIEELDKHIKIAKTINEDTSDLVVTLRTLLAEENTAAASYTEKAKKLEELGYTDIAKVLLDIANEELVHAGEIQALLDRNGISAEEQAIEGKEEIEELIGEE